MLFSGAGNSDSSPYLITSAEDWNGLVSNVYLGQNYSYTYNTAPPTSPAAPSTAACSAAKPKR